MGGRNAPFDEEKTLDRLAKSQGIDDSLQRSLPLLWPTCTGAFQSPKQRLG